MRKLTREWIKKAEADYRVAAKLASDNESFHDQVCFHCQQSAEKHLKALLQELALNIPRTHSLRDLVNLLMPHHLMLRKLQRGADFLARFAVETRYPGESANKRQAKAALRWADRFRETSRKLLGIRTRRRKLP